MAKARKQQVIEVESRPSFALSTRFVVVSTLLFAFVLFLSTLFVTHVENDELIYLTLADKVSKNLSDYSLQGTAILVSLPQGTYNQPVFLRPPLFVYLLAFVGLFHAHSLLPAFAGVGVIWTTFTLGQKLGFKNSTAWAAGIVLALCPILLFVSVRILIDALLTFLVTATLLLFVVAVDKRNSLLFAAAGVVFGLSILSKETAVLMVPALLYVNFRQGVTAERMKSFLYFAVPAIVVCSPWFYYFHEMTGSFFKGSVITEENLKLPFISMMVNRPWYFYVVQVISVAPVYAFGYFEVGERIKKREPLTEPIWVVSYFLPLTIFGLMGQGYQTRYVLPAIPGLALLSASGLERRGQWATMTAIVLLGYGLWTGILNSVLFRAGDLFWPFQFLMEFAAKIV